MTQQKCICCDLLNHNQDPMINPDCPIHGRSIPGRIKVFIYHASWKYAAYNFEYGLVRAHDPEEAEKIVRKTTGCRSCYITEPEFDDEGVCSIYAP